MAVAVTVLVCLLTTADYAAAQRVQPYEQGRPAGVAGRFDYYVLSLSWSPTYCAEQSNAQQDAQCRLRDGRRFAFVLHGLWPQYERGFPEFCPTGTSPFVPQGVIDRMLDIMPARPLVIHEYRKHGTCSGLEPRAYYDMARRLFERIKIPPRFVDPGRDQIIDTRAVVDEFTAANPGLMPENLAVTCGGTGNRMREVRVCFTRDGALRPCGVNEDARKLCRSPRVHVPPVRLGGGFDNRSPRPDQRGRIIPGPVPPAGVRNL
jgi:ribonuclease T2